MVSGGPTRLPLLRRQPPGHFIFGAELNRELEHQTAEDSTVGPAEPMGERGAWAADHVAGGAGEEDSDRIERWREPGPTLSEASPPTPDLSRSGGGPAES